MGNNQGTTNNDADFEMFEDEELIPLLRDIVGEDFSRESTTIKHICACLKIPVEFASNETAFGGLLLTVHWIFFSTGF